MKAQQVDIQNLQTIKNYAVLNNVTASYIYKLAKENKMQIVNIDGVQFVNTKQYPVLPTKKD
jgi:ABC-type antimicrobial peptide transport system permease subunit